MKKLLISALLFSFSLINLNAQYADEEARLRAVVDGMATAWTNGDGAGFAHYFADEHDYFVWNGIYFPDHSKEMNAMGHQRLFDEMYKDTRHYAVVDKIRFVKPDVAVLLVMSAVVPKSDPRPEHPQVLWSATLTKFDGDWKIVSFHNADIEVLDNEDSRANSPMPTEVMFKNWYAAMK